MENLWSVPHPSPFTLGGEPPSVPTKYKAVWATEPLVRTISKRDYHSSVWNRKMNPHHLCCKDREFWNEIV
jgi:hypothetical protein